MSQIMLDAFTISDFLAYKRNMIEQSNQGLKIL